MFKDRGPKTVYDQQLNVTTADKQRAQAAFDIAKKLQSEGKNIAAEKHRQIGRDILGLNLTQGVAHGEEAEVKHKKGRTETGEEYVSVVASASNKSKLPKQFRVDHRKAIAMSSQRPLNSNPQMLKTASSLFADNAIKVVKIVGRGLGKTIKVTWNLFKKPLEIQNARRILREREQKLINEQANKLEKANREDIVLPKKVRAEAQQIENREWKRQRDRETELRQSEVLTVTRKKGGRILFEVTHEEPEPPWRTE